MIHKCLQDYITEDEMACMCARVWGTGGETDKEKEEETTSPVTDTGLSTVLTQFPSLPKRQIL